VSTIDTSPFVDQIASRLAYFDLDAIATHEVPCVG